MREGEKEGRKEDGREGWGRRGRQGGREGGRLARKIDYIDHHRSPSTGASISYTMPWTQPFPAE